MPRRKLLPDTTIPAIPSMVGAKVNLFCQTLHNLSPESLDHSDILFVKSKNGEFEGEVRAVKDGHDCPLPERVVQWWIEYAKSNPDWVKENPIVKKFLAFRGIEVSGFTPSKTQETCGRIYKSHFEDIPRENIYIAAVTKPSWSFGEFKYKQGEGDDEIICPLPERTIQRWVVEWNLEKNADRRARYGALLAGLQFYGNWGDLDFEDLAKPSRPVED